MDTAKSEVNESWMSLYWILDERKIQKGKSMKTGVSKCHKFRICPFFVPLSKDVI